MCQVPYPVHGSSIIGKTVLEILESAQDLKVDFIDIGLSKNIKSINKANPYKVLTFVQILKRLAMLLLSKEYDTIYFAATLTKGGLIKDSILRLVLKLNNNARVLIHSHNKIPKVLKFYERTLILFLLKDNELIVLSERLDFPQISWCFEKKYVLPNGMEDMSNGDVQNKKNPKLKFLFLSNFINSKGVIRTLDAFIHYKNVLNGEGEIEFVGNDGDISKSTIIDRAHEGSVSSYVIVSGPKYGKEKYKILSQSDAFIFPSTYPMEIQPLSLIEATMFGLPIISYDNGAIGDIVNDNNGYLLSVESTIEEIALCMLRLEDVELRMSFAKNSRKQYDANFTISRFKKSLLNII